MSQICKSLICSFESKQKTNSEKIEKIKATIFSQDPWSKKAYKRTQVSRRNGGFREFS